MSTHASDYVTLVEVLELTRPFDEVAPLITAAISRLATEGVRALISMQFYTNEAKTEFGGIITFSDSTQLMEHVNMISGWEEFRRFTTMIKVIDIRVHGKLSPDVEAWMHKFNDPLKKFPQHVVGFIR